LPAPIPAGDLLDKIGVLELKSDPGCNDRSGVVSSPMAVSPCTTKIVQQPWRGLVCAILLFTALLGGAAQAQDPRYFRIGTAATGGSFFEIGGIVAGAISGPTEGPPCGRGGSCGVPGLVAVAQATPGSVENLRLINAGQIESGFAQADLAGWAYNGQNLFAEPGPQLRLRAIASLFPSAAHLVVAADSPIRSLADLHGKSIAIGEGGSGSAAAAAVVLKAAGYGPHDPIRRNLRPGPSAAELKAGTVDAWFLVGGYPVPAIRDLAATSPIRLIPIEGEVIDNLKKDFTFYRITEIPAGTYPTIDAPIPTFGFSALWLVNSDVATDLVYAITKSLWNPATVKLLNAHDAIGKYIKPERALDGLSVPLHPGAARFYRETGLPIDSVPRIAGEPGNEKGP
jgi:TRAP transporter TAXI family solute receptor